MFHKVWQPKKHPQLFVSILNNKNHFENALIPIKAEKCVCVIYYFKMNTICLDICRKYTLLVKSLEQLRYFFRFEVTSAY